MFRSRLTYAITLACAILFYIVYQPWFSWYLLTLLLLLVPLDLLMSLPGMLSTSVRLSAPAVLEKNAGGVLTVTSISKKSFPLKCLNVRLNVIGDDFAMQCNALVPVGTVNHAAIDCDTSATGLTVFTIKRLRAVSLLGLLSKPLKDTGKAAVLVLPPPQKPEGTVDLPRGVILTPKPGGGFSEEHEMRAYQPGDPLKSIHWKISAKFDELIIREPLVPVQQSRFVHVMPWKNAAERDSALSHLRWISDYLISHNMPFYIKYGERQLVCEINTEADLIDFLHRALDNSAVLKSTQPPRMTRYSWTYKIRGDAAAETER